MILKILKLYSPKGPCNFENFQNHSYLLITNCTWGRAISYTNYITYTYTTYTCTTLQYDTKKNDLKKYKTTYNTILLLLRTFIFYFILKYLTFKKTSLLKFTHNGLHLRTILMTLPGLKNKSDILNNTQYNCNKFTV